MQKRLDLFELDIPKNDIDCWIRYPHHRWIYETTRLLDSQNIPWSPFKTETFSEPIDTMHLSVDDNIEIRPGQIFIEKITDEMFIVELYIIKGEIKLARYLDALKFHNLSIIQGTLELKLNAFITRHFHKFTGVISMHMCKAGILKAILRTIDSIINEDPEISKLLKRIYKKSELSKENSFSVKS